MSPTFILAPTPPSSSSTNPLPASPALNLLPFSLGPTSKPYTSTTAPLSTYFRPRPAPAGIPGVDPGTPIAAFRGRQVAGQSIPIPRGYRGIIISADRPDIITYASGASADQQESEPTRGRTRRDKWPLTPAASSASVGDEGQEGDGTEMRRSPRKAGAGMARLKQRVKGAGQTALARPKRGVQKTGTKRFRLDSDDEDGEDADEGSLTPEPPAVIPPPAPVGTPAKRARPSLASTTPTRQSPRLTQPRTPAPASTRKLPAIQLIEATPLKEPLPPPPPHLRRKKNNKADYVIPGSPGAEPIVVEDIKEEQEEAGIIPSPATEDDPPTFPIPSPSPAADTEVKPSMAAVVNEPDYSAMMDIEGAVRVLRPVSTFDAITLWTPDSALAGYKPPLQGEAAGEKVDVKGKGKAKEEEEEVKEEQGAELEGPKVRQGWWAQGGSGEGGDEVVRAMGEWLGLVEMLNKPVYLDTCKDEEGDDEEDA